MTDDEIFARIENDVENVWKGTFGRLAITIWMTIDLFDHLFPEQFVLQKGCAMMTLFGCKVRVVISPCDGMRWIVGYEGKVEEEKDDS